MIKLKETALVVCQNTAVALRVALPMLIVCGAMFILSGGTVYAQEDPEPEAPLTFTPMISSSELGGVVDSIQSTVSAVIKKAIVVGIALFAAFLAYKVMKRFIRA